jgi:hypothetical protein
MAEAKLYKGRAIVAYVDGQAVDSDGKVIEGAPRQPKDTPREQQPAAGGVLAPEERVAVAVARAMKDPDGVLSRAGALPTGSGEAASEVIDDDEELPTLADMPQYLASINNVDQVKALQAKDDRKGAQDLYDARIAELGG